MNLIEKKFFDYLTELDYPTPEIKQYSESEIYCYTYTQTIKAGEFHQNRIDFKFFYIPETNFDDKLHQIHSDLWNQNTDNFFIAVTNTKTYLLEVKQKPQKSKRFELANFNYGVDNQGSIPQDLKEKITFESINSNYFFDFLFEKLKNKKKNEVDKDLLASLIALKNKFLTFENDNDKINLLILRCLFIKYLEDRGVYETSLFTQALQSKSPQILLNSFEEIKKINGDIFKSNDLTIDNITVKHLEELNIFFSSDYQTHQIGIFPYKFDMIPIQLISNVYEEFLDKTDKKKKGVFYTRTFVVDFMLSCSVIPKLNDNIQIKILDPACGSGAFLVQAFKTILNKTPNLSLEDKASILQNQLFGIDRDLNALRIAAFSLYLALLEGEKPEKIRELIRIKQPILPSLIGNTLIKGNTITDKITFKINNKECENLTFDCVIGNPPWGLMTSLAKADDEERKERECLKSWAVYQSISKRFPQKSQCFILRVSEWSKENTVICLIVNNSSFLNPTSIDFRKEFLNKYSLDSFYELSDISDILFKATKEPCAILIFNNQINSEKKVKYITPKLSKLSKYLQIIHFTEFDKKEITQKDLILDDIIWKIFVKGNWNDYQIIKKQFINKSQTAQILMCEQGIQGQLNESKNKEAQNYVEDNKPLITPEKTKRYDLLIDEESLNIFDTIDWGKNYKRERKPELYIGERILIKRTPTAEDNFKLMCIYTNQMAIFKDNMIVLKFKGHINYISYLAILNSKFIGYCIGLIASQFNKGAGYTAIKNEEIKSLPFPKLDTLEKQSQFNQLSELVKKIEQAKKEKYELFVQNTDNQIDALEEQIDEIVFDLYDLLDYERETIREFYQVNIERKNDRVRDEDLQSYVDRFRKVFDLMMNQDLALEVSYDISSNFGAILRFAIIPKNDLKTTQIQKINIKGKKILQLVKQSQLEESFLSNKLNESKFKLYEKNAFYLIKSNYFKDWTLYQAIEDANEELGLILNAIYKK